MVPPKTFRLQIFHTLWGWSLGCQQHPHRRFVMVGRVPFISYLRSQKRMIIAQRFHDDCAFHESIVGYFWSVLGRVRLIHHFLFYRYSLKRLWFLLHVFGGPADWCLVDSCYSWGMLSFGIFWSKSHVLPHDFAWLEEDPISNSLDD